MQRAPVWCEYLELPTVKPAELKYSQDVSLDYSSQRIYKLPCCRSDRSHETKLNQQKHKKRKVWVWLFYFLCGNSRPVSKSRLCCNSLQYFEHIFCCAGNGIAAEHIVAVVFVVNENCPHVFAAQEKELLLNNS